MIINIFFSAALFFFVFDIGEYKVQRAAHSNNLGPTTWILIRGLVLGLDPDKGQVHLINDGGGGGGGDSAFLI